MHTLLYALSILVAPAAADAGPFTYQFEQLAPNVWVGVRPDPPRFPVMGTTTFVIRDDGVVVFDGGGMPAMADQVIAKIRSLTDEPVTHVVISHWHGDHHFGAFRFAEEFPGVEIVAHEFTRDVIDSTRIAYIDRQRSFMEKQVPAYREILETGVDSDGSDLDPVDRRIYERVLEDAEVIDVEFRHARVTPPTAVFSDRYTIGSGDDRVELLFLGHGNTAGDVVMWLPGERIVAAGDLVVLPSPYAFNMPPRPWARTLEAVKALGYRALVPGHGEVQRDTTYLDLLIEVADSVADQRDALMAEGRSAEEVEAALDFSAYEPRFTHGDDYVRVHFEDWFETPFRAAAMKAATGEPMVAIEPPTRVPFDDERWRLEGDDTEVVDHLGQRALRLTTGAAVLPDVALQNAIVEFDVAVEEERGFAGLVFRVQDDDNFEEFYIRPHQSGNPDANQYQPVFNRSAAWQLYHGEGYGAVVKYRFGEWMRVKVVYAGTRAEVSIDSDEPVLRVDPLRHGEIAGAIGVRSTSDTPVHFANFTYAPLADAYALRPGGVAEAPTPPGTITEWEVSEVFDAESLSGVARLDGAALEGDGWTQLDAEATGITNLARIRARGEGKDTVFARFFVEAEEAGPKRLRFGYSDLARVYLNGTLLYQGDNRYRSRDYRYLGTIGLFDSVVLPLEAGRNDVRIAVTEEFGGWGVMARVEELGAGGSSPD